MMPQGPNLAANVDRRAMPLFLKIRDNHQRAQYFAYYLEFLTFHLPEARLVPALEWLIRNKIVGQKFLDFVENECARSGLELIRHLTMRLEKEKKVRALYQKDIA